MKNEKQKEIVQKFQKLLDANSFLRIGQLMSILTMNDDVFYLEDDVLEKRIDAMCNGSLGGTEPHN